MKRPNTAIPDFTSSLSSSDDRSGKIEDSDSAAQILLSFTSKRTVYPLDRDDPDDEKRSRPSKKRRTDRKMIRADPVLSTGALVSDDEDELPLDSVRTSRQRNKVTSSSDSPKRPINQVPLSKPLLCASNWRAISRPLPPPPRSMHPPRIQDQVVPVN